MEGWNFWWGIAAFFLGGLATQLNGWLAYRRQRKDRADDAADVLRQRREEFELQHLMEFNQLLTEAIEKLGDYSVSVSQYVHLRDTNSLDDAAEQRREEVGKSLEVMLSKVTAQLEFILAEDVRRSASVAANKMLDAMGLLHANNSPDMMAVWNVSGAVYQVLGKRVRAIYEGRQ
ncbi:hypothetical protein AB0H30_27040 [Streptomyces pseudogriseolus]|uniref:hypothetical protein n=1 Tax=Streptomyces pseudogriseolus TaxID=36817 RepID=UPI00347FFE5B